MNNLAILQGVVSQMAVDYDVFGCKYHKFRLSTARKSGVMDILNCETHSEFCQTSGDYVRITGRVRCRGIRIGGKIECDMYVECDSVEVTTQWDDTDKVYLSGTLSRVGDLRLTPQSHREIVDFAVRVNNGTTTEYIQCIAWGKGARKIASKKRGDKVSFVGRFQSRDYAKRLGNNKEEIRTAYEVSCNYILKEGNANEIETVKYDAGKLYVLRKRMF